MLEVTGRGLVQYLGLADTDKFVLELALWQLVALTWPKEEQPLPLGKQLCSSAEQAAAALPGLSL